MAIREFPSTVSKVEWMTKDVVFLSLKIPEDFSFKAGQYIMLKMAQNDVTRLKPYSILSPPSQKGSLDLCVKLVDGGFASEIFRHVKVADEFVVKGPFGHFLFDEETDNEHWFVCTGTGVTPFVSMIKEYLNKRPSIRFSLLFGVRTQEDLFLLEELRELARQHENFTFIPTLTRDKWVGKTGRVQEHLPADLGGKTFYICGLKDLVLETRDLLSQKGVNPKDVRFERYN